MKCNSILPMLWSGTPLVRLNRVTKDLPAEVWVKADYLNPGGSLKDPHRAANSRRKAERKGQLRPGGTIVEATTGNTGVGAGADRPAVRGYKTVFTVPDKLSVAGAKKSTC